MTSHKLANYLRAYRKRSGLSQSEVAYLLGCKNGAQVSRYGAAASIRTSEHAQSGGARQDSRGGGLDAWTETSGALVLHLADLPLSDWNPTNTRPSSFSSTARFFLSSFFSPVRTALLCTDAQRQISVTRFKQGHKRLELCCSFGGMTPAMGCIEFSVGTDRRLCTANHCRV